MNPPFSNGDKHLLKALKMQEKGGAIICLLNAETIRKICSSVNIPVQMGGGIRTLENIQEVLDLGVYRVIIGTKAVENPDCPG